MKKKLFFASFLILFLSNPSLSFDINDLKSVSPSVVCEKCDLTSANLRGVNFTNGNFRGSNLSNSDFTGGYLSQIKLNNVQGVKTNFTSNNTSYYF